MSYSFSFIPVVGTPIATYPSAISTWENGTPFFHTIQLLGDPHFTINGEIPLVELDETNDKNGGDTSRIIADAPANRFTVKGLVTTRNGDLMTRGSTVLATQSHWISNF